MTAALVIGGGFTNKGAEAMLLTLARAVRERLPAARVYARVPAHEREVAQESGVCPVVVSGAKGFWAARIGTLRQGYVALRSQAVYDISGFLYGDAWGPAPMRQRERFFKACKRFGARPVVMPQAWGPFDGDAMPSAARSLISSAKRVFVRDNTSLACISALYDCLPQHVTFGHDIAWAFEAGAADVGRSLLNEALGSAEGADVICITPNLRVYERTGVGTSEHPYLLMLKHIVRRLRDHYGYRVLLLGHELRVRGDDRRDDRWLCCRILDEIGDDSGVGHVNRWLDASEVKALIGCCTMLIGSRYHAIVAAASQLVPPLAFGWSHKYDELLRELGIPHRLARVVTDRDEIDAMLDRHLRDNAVVRSQLAERVPLMRRSAVEVLQTAVSQIER